MSKSPELKKFLLDQLAKQLEKKSKLTYILKVVGASSSPLLVDVLVFPAVLVFSVAIPVDRPRGRLRDGCGRVPK